MFDRLGILIGFSIVGVLGAGIFAADVFNLFPRDSFDTALERVVACTRAKNATACSRPAVKEMLGFRSAAEVMDALSVRLTPQQCHHVGHVVGQQSLVLSQDLERSVTRCTRTCDSACVHGAIGQAFAQELGLEDSSGTQDFDLQHLGAEEARTIGRRLCVSTEACHGVGHVLFQAHGSFESALSLCREIAAGANRSYCYHGVYMEYADILSSREIRPTPNVIYPTPESLDALCGSQPSFEEKVSCFPYFPRIVDATFRARGLSSSSAMAHVRELCAAYPDQADRAACFFGVGFSSSYSLMEDTLTAVKICQQFPTPLDRIACNLGQVSASTRDRQPEVIAYCAALPDLPSRTSCYQAVFYYLSRSGTPMQDAAKLCGGDSVCERESEHYESVPLERILEGFGV